MRMGKLYIRHSLQNKKGIIVYLVRILSTHKFPGGFAPENEEKLVQNKFEIQGLQVKDAVEIEGGGMLYKISKF